MIFRDNTSTGGYYLCSDCKLGLDANAFYEDDGHYVCKRTGYMVHNVGICNLFEGRIKNDG